MKLFAILLLAAAGTAGHAAAPAPAPGVAKYEIRFMEDMIEHHMMAVHMGEMCLTKAFHPELQSMCQQIITTQQQEITTMQQWLAAWYGIPSHQHEMNPGHHNRMEKLGSLSGAEFEIEFMQQMIRHHKMAVVKGAQCVERSYHTQLQDLCANMVSAQLAEIRQMQTWLCTWYGLCRPRRES